MLHFVNTSLLEAHTQTVVNTVNTVGVMGKGLAKHFASKYPEMFKHYKRYCLSGDLDIGKLWLWKASDQWVLNFPTKKHWRNPSKLEYIEVGLQKFIEKYEEKGITEISFPRLGCGNGGLDWDAVRPLMELYLAKLPIAVYIHDFEVDIGAPEHKLDTASGTFLRSFESFLSDLNRVIQNKEHSFRTISTQQNFSARIDSSNDLFLAPRGEIEEVRVARDELYEAWQMLLIGPLTADRLVGDARDQSSYLLGLFATLPYIRPVQLRNSAISEATIGVELVERLTETELLTAE